MNDEKDQALERLRNLAIESKSKMDISDIIEAVLDSDFDQELERLVRIALEACPDAMTFEMITSGIMGIQSWREGNS